MGSALSRFISYLDAGREQDAIKYFHHQNFPQDFNPSGNLAKHNNSSPIHIACREGLPIILTQMLERFRKTGFPVNLAVTNRMDQSILHACCSVPGRIRATVEQLDRRKLDCVEILFQDPLFLDLVPIDAVDKDGNSALHLASLNGFKQCCDALLARGASLKLKNGDKKTPADLAGDSAFRGLALKLEADVLFEDQGPGQSAEELAAQDALRQDSHHQGMKLQDLRAEKDELLIEVSSFVGLSMEKADQLLRHFEYNKGNLIESWLKDSSASLKAAGLDDIPSIPLPGAVPISESASECQICGDEQCEGDDENEACELLALSCDHYFCRDCWSGYLTSKVQDANVETLVCPMYKCNIRVTNSMVEDMVDEDTARKFLQFDLKSFVDNNPDVKWCPAPNCGRVLRRPKNADRELELRDRVMGTTVGCGNGHFFCFNCSSEPHAPCSCEAWEIWQAELKERNIEMSNHNYEKSDLATEFWLSQNTKPCPKCRSSIEKAQGCNHMTCRKCRHQFCWICLESWSKHGQRTGGYYNCSRFKGQGPSTASEESQLAQRTQEQSAHFLHFFDHFAAHDASHRLEEPMRQTAIDRYSELCLLRDHLHVDPSFIDQAYNQLLLNRLALRNSYAFGFVLSNQNHQRFEDAVSSAAGQALLYAQSVLAESTETLSDMIARPHLRGTRQAVIHTALLCHRLRGRLFEVIVTGKRAHLNKLKKKWDAEDASLRDLAPVQRKPSPKSSENRPALARALSSNRVWQCETCTLLNPEIALVCQACSSVQPEQVKFRSPEEIKEDNKIVKCGSCSYDNVFVSAPHTSEPRRCEVCGNSLVELGTPAAASVEVKDIQSLWEHQEHHLAALSEPAAGDEEWTCSVCTFRGNVGQVACAICASFREGAMEVEYSDPEVWSSSSSAVPQVY